MPANLTESELEVLDVARKAIEECICGEEDRQRWRRTLQEITAKLEGSARRKDGDMNCRPIPNDWDLEKLEGELWRWHHWCGNNQLYLSLREATYCAARVVGVLRQAKVMSAKEVARQLKSTAAHWYRNSDDAGADEGEYNRARHHVYRACADQLNAFASALEPDHNEAPLQNADESSSARPGALDTPWPARDVVAKLAESADILLHRESYDGHGYEEINQALDVARAWLKQDSAARPLSVSELSMGGNGRGPELAARGSPETARTPTASSGAIVKGRDEMDRGNSTGSESRETGAAAEPAGELTREEAQGAVAYYCREAEFSGSSSSKLMARLARAALRSLDLQEALARAQRSSKRDGEWLDEMGCCKLCDGEIPYGHEENCHLWKLEQRIKLAESDLARTKAELEGRTRERDEARAELAAVRRHPIAWHCTCGWVNGINRVTCVACGRAPADGGAVLAQQPQEQQR